MRSDGSAARSIPHHASARSKIDAQLSASAAAIQPGVTAANSLTSSSRDASRVAPTAASVAVAFAILRVSPRDRRRHQNSIKSTTMSANTTAPRSIRTF
jgi:hypothetical protein